MRIVLTAGAAPRLESAEDFKRFSIALDGTLTANRSAAVAPVAELDDADHAWVRPDAIRAISPFAGQPDWENGFAAMLGFAVKHGWVDAQGRIRAHIDEIEELPPVDADAFRQAMRRFASGVCIVAAGSGEARCGMTVSAFSSVSAEPPIVLVCLNRRAAAHACVTSAPSFSINILRADQTEEAMLFAGQRVRHGAERFDHAWEAGDHGAPLLKTALQSLICTSLAQHEAGSHTVLIGRVVSVTAGSPDAALVNYDGALGRFDRAS